MKGSYTRFMARQARVHNEISLDELKTERRELIDRLHAVNKKIAKREKSREV